MRFFSLLGMCILISGCSIGKSTVWIPLGTKCDRAFELEKDRTRRQVEKLTSPESVKRALRQNDELLLSEDELAEQFDSCDNVATAISVVSTIVAVGLSVYTLCAEEGKCGNRD